VRELSHSLSLLECLRFSDDPADPIALLMAKQFSKARPRLSQLESQSCKCRETYAKLLAHFNHAGMKTSDFVLLWDDLFVPRELILGKPEALQKQDLLPAFCRPRVVPTVGSFLALWEICASNRYIWLMQPSARPCREAAAANAKEVAANNPCEAAAVGKPEEETRDEREQDAAAKKAINRAAKKEEDHGGNLEMLGAADGRHNSRTARLVSEFEAAELSLRDLGSNGWDQHLGGNKLELACAIVAH